MWSSWRGYRCQARGEGCPIRAWRFCRVCGRWLCRFHRLGAGWWWRCLGDTCPAAELAAIRRDLQLARLLCRRCGRAMRTDDEVFWRPQCDCPP